jgi:hypothetical protein
MCGGLPLERRNFRYLLLTAFLAAATTALPRCVWADESAKPNAPATSSQLAVQPVGNVASRPAATDSSPANAARWIQQLGDDRFEVREEASRHLSQMTVEIQPALDAALRNPDPEVRVRVRRILETILKADLEKRLAAFADDVNDEKHLDLPGWSRYRKIIGGAGPARKLFVEMQRAEPNLFRAVDDGPAATATALERCILRDCTQMVRIQMRMGTYGGNMVSLGSVSAMLFVGSDKNVAIADDLATQLVNMTNQQAIQQAVNGSAQNAAVRKILGAWVSRDATSVVLWQNLMLAMRLDLKEGIEPACSALRQGNQPANVKQMALMLIGKLGDKTNLPVVETCLKDTDLLAQFNMNNQLFQTEVRDVALAVFIKLAGKDPKDFGFDRFDTNSLQYYNLATMGFRNAADRDAAAKKWEDWIAAHHITADASTPAKKS